MGPVATTLLSSLGAIVACVIALWVVSLARRDSSVVDPFWGFGFVIVVWIAWLPSQRRRLTCSADSSVRARPTPPEGVRTDTGEPFCLSAGFLWMCQGYYRHSEGYTPEWPGMADFKGRIVHPQTWPKDLDVTGKKVVVIGSGATAATVVPAIAEKVEHVTMLQRSPTYFIPARNANDLADQLRTHDKMPLVSNLGHMVPSGCALWSRGAELAPGLSAAADNLQLMVSLYNSQKVIRLELQKEGAGYRASEHDFLTLTKTGAHLTDVVEAPDGSLIHEWQLIK